jgi:transcriptional regulator with GAF, ATPase, and Fis domain
VPPTEPLSTSAALPRLEAGQLRVLDGPDRGLQREIGPEPLTIGTGEGCTMLLKDAKVSRRHLEVRLGTHGFLLRDLGSRNGTFFEDSRIVELSVPPGAVLRIGQSALLLTSASGTELVPPSTADHCGELVGTSIAMKRVYTLLERAAPSGLPVLLGGESGTGKELAAKALHALSPVAGGPFVIVDCAAIAPTLLHSELFGHERGAFTGAATAHAGAFERADGGTVFLDEIGELPLALQGALLRVCDTQEIQRLGADAPRTVRARLVAATHRDLAQDVVDGRFRRDLFYRLQVFPITLPPLRNRKGDLPILTRRFLDELGHRAPVEGPALAALQALRFPGNVRQLRNVLARAHAQYSDRPFPEWTFMADNADAAAVDRTGSFQEQRQQALDAFERQFLSKLLRESAGNIRSASRNSGIERTQLKRLLRRHNLI